MNKEEFYLNYVKACHSSTPISNRKEIDSTSSEDEWTVRGNIGAFRWWAFSTFYHPDFHKMNEMKLNANEDFQIKMSLPGCMVGISFTEAINRDEELCAILRNPVILNLSAYMTGREKESMLKFEEFMYEGIGQEHEVFYFNQEHQQMAVRQPLIMKKDVIFMSYRASETMLQNFAMLAPNFIAAGANSVIGLFICRVKPSVDGRTPEYFPEGYHIPHIEQIGGMW